MVEFDDASVIKSELEIDKFVPSRPHWNFVSLKGEHPRDKGEDPAQSGGKWIFWVPNSDFVEVFRKLARLTADMELTSRFKTSLEMRRGKHIFCVYCKDYRDIGFVREIAQTLEENGLLKYGDKVHSDSDRIFFKTNIATRIKGETEVGELSLFKYVSGKGLYVCEYNGRLQSWRAISNEEKEFYRSFNAHLLTLEGAKNLGWIRRDSTEHSHFGPIEKRRIT